MSSKSSETLISGSEESETSETSPSLSPITPVTEIPGIPYDEAAAWLCFKHDGTPDPSCASCAARRYVYNHPSARTPDDVIPGRCTIIKEMSNEMDRPFTMGVHRCHNFANSWCYTDQQAVCHTCHIRTDCYCMNKVYNLNWMHVLIVLEKNDRNLKHCYVYVRNYYLKRGMDKYRSWLGECPVKKRRAKEAKMIHDAEQRILTEMKLRAREERIAKEDQRLDDKERLLIEREQRLSARLTAEAIRAREKEGNGDWCHQLT